MINEASVLEVEAARLNDYFRKPLYESYGFSQIPQTIFHRLTGEGPAGLPGSVLESLPDRYREVVLLLIDAFGWRFFAQYADRYPFLKRFVDRGVVSKLTSQFPSTTAAHVTTIHSGLPVGESGVFEWFYYEPKLDAIIAPLLFSFAGDKARNTLSPTGIAPEELYPRQTLYERLKQQGIKSYVFQNRSYAPSPFSDALFAGAQVVPYRLPSEAVVNLADAVIAERGPAYFFLYLDGIDAMGHAYGPASRPFAAEVDATMTLLEHVLHGTLSGRARDTLLLVTADHGQIEVSPETTIYLNRLQPSIEPLLRTNRRGERLVPAGSPRDMFLYVPEEHLDEAQDRLTGQLDGRAEVHPVQDLIAQGCFGAGTPSATFLSRVGDLVILPYPGESVWWYERGRFEQNFYGHHGGLAREEIETVLLALAY